MPIPVRSVRSAGAAVTAAALACTAALAVPSSAGAAPQAAAWSATATKAVSYDAKHSGGVRLSTTRKSQPVHLAVALKPRNAKQMRTALRAMYRPGSASYHHYLTAAQWRAAYAPSTAAVAAVQRYLRAQGFRNVAATGNRLVVQADGTAAQAERAFNTSLVNYRLGSRTVYANAKRAMVPAALGGTVAAVIGLNDLPLTAVKTTARKASAPAAAGSPSTAGLYPAQFDTTYDAVGTKRGIHTPIAILTEGATKGVISSLRYAEAKENMPRVPVTVVRVGSQSADTSGADEFDMDSQVSTMVANRVPRLYMYNVGALLDSDITADFAKYVSQDRAKALSASIGGCEVNSYLDGSELTTDVVMQEGAMQGQSLFASSGDNGDACMYVAAIGAPVGVPGVNWPASGTFDTAVGGTSLLSDAKGNRIQELGWLGSGGGYSYVENPGWWTQDTDQAFSGEYVSGGRAVPDVALDADPNVATPAKIYVGKTIMYVGGTSLSSPMMLGFWARMETAHNNRLGLASIPLYRVFDKVNPGIPVDPPLVVQPNPNPKAVPGYTDIVAGSNGTYTARPGWDEVTGLGAPDVKKLVKVVK